MSVDFDGADDFLSCGSGATLDNIAQKTITMWVYMDSYGESDGFFVCKAAGATSNTGWHFYATDTNDTLRYQHGWADSASDRAAWVSANDSAPVGAWRHVAVSYDRGATGNDPVFYSNGVLSATTESEAPAGTVIDDSAQTLYVGNEAGATRTMDGRIVDLRIFNRILSANEVAILAAGHRGPLGGEALWFSMNEARGAFTGTLTQGTHVLPDRSVNSNDGDPYNGCVMGASDAPRYGVAV